MAVQHFQLTPREAKDLSGVLFRRRERNEFAQFVNNCIRGRHTHSPFTVDAPNVDIGTILKATDRDYEVTRRGWRKLSEIYGPEDRLPARLSQIRLVPVVKEYPRRRDAA